MQQKYQVCGDPDGHLRICFYCIKIGKYFFYAPQKLRWNLKKKAHWKRKNIYKVSILGSKLVLGGACTIICIWYGPLPWIPVTTRIITCLGSGIPINLHGLHCYREGAISNILPTEFNEDSAEVAHSFGIKSSPSPYRFNSY